MSGVKGGMTSLRSLRRRLARVGSEKGRTELARMLAEESLKQVNDSFRTTSDPYDEKWEPSTRVKYSGGQTLSDNGILRRSINYRDVTPRGFIIGSPLVYANIHQWGGIIKAKTPKGLSFKLPVAFDIATARTSLKTRKTKYRRLKRGVLREERINVMSVKMPRRSFLPYKKTPMPPRWKQAWTDATRPFFEKMMR